MTTDETADKPARRRVLDPVSRLSEILFGLLMVLTFTGTFSVANAGESSVRELLIASLGCNLAWGLVDACMMLLNRLAERSYTLRLMQQLQELPLGSPQAFALLTEAMPVLAAQVMRTEDLRTLHQRVLELRITQSRPELNLNDLLQAYAVFMAVVFASLPVIVPFVLIDQPLHALRASHAVALVMLFLIGLGYGRFAHARHPAITASVFTLLGVALVIATIALGG